MLSFPFYFNPQLLSHAVDFYRKISEHSSPQTFVCLVRNLSVVKIYFIPVLHTFSKNPIRDVGLKCHFLNKKKFKKLKNAFKVEN